MTETDPISLNQAWKVRWPAPAKINRFLHIVGQRADGYHLLQSVFQIVDFCDFLTFSHCDNQCITLKDSIPSVEDKDNLVIKAALLLQEHCQINTGVCISLEKNLPMGAGLGGGSSNAATTLLALNLLWNCQLTIEEISKLGIKLGADVPFFIQGKNALVEGIGEKITPLSIDCPWLQLSIPNCHISTKDIFQASHLRRDTPKISLQQLNQLETNQEQQLLLLDFGHNDCEKVVLDENMQIKQLFMEMKPYSNPRITGTGSCIFSAFPNKIDATHAIPQNFLQNSFQHQLLIKKTLSESPILPIIKKFNKIHPDLSK